VYYSETMPDPVTLYVLVERAGDWWVARCLQLNVGTQARSLRELYQETLKIIADHFETAIELGVNPFRQKAPPELWEKYSAAEMAASPVHPEEFFPSSMASSARVETRIAA
jgi:hypothetical protein